MVFPFGISISDFLAGVKLIKVSIEACSGMCGARADYAELARSTGSLEQVLSEASKAVLDTQPRRDALKQAIDNCQTCITDFLASIEQFNRFTRSLRDSYGLISRKAITSKFAEGLRMMQWTVCKNEDVMAFRAKVEMHINALNMLLLSSQVETLMRLNASADNINRVVLGIQEDAQHAGAMTQNALTQQSNNIESLGKRVTLQSSVAASNSDTLQQIQQRLKSALSPEDQRLILRMLQETLKKNEELESQMEALKCQNQCLERHMLEVKTTIQLQKNIPPQVLLQQPVILHDAIERIAPFHLEFINSAAALKAVLKIRFRHVGLWKILANEYSFRDLNRKADIDLSKAWERNFLPRQHVEMSMWYPDNGSNNCPGCGFQDTHHFEQGEQAKCSKCSMMYCRTKLPIHFHELETRPDTSPENQYETEDISSFCRVDLIRKDEPDPVFCEKAIASPDSWSGAGEGWYCPECHDGPIFDCVPVCSNCGYRRA